MAAALVDVAAAVVAMLSAGPTIDASGVATSISGQPARISQALNVSRVHVPRFNPPDQAAGAWQVLVSTAGEETERIGRNELQATYHIEIGVCGKLASLLDVPSVDAALLALQQMGDLFFDYGLSGNSSVWQRNNVYFWPDRDRIAQDGVVLAVWDAVFAQSRHKAGA